MSSTLIPVTDDATLSVTQPQPGWPHFDAEQVDAAAAVLASGKVNYWTGEHGKRFEQDFAAFCGARRGIALANGTVALEAALKVLGIGPGDEVVVTPRTFMASATSVAWAGATPVFADIDRETQNLTPQSIAAVLTPATRALIVVHLGGWPCDMHGMLELAREHGLAVIEDCAQAHGARIGGQHVGTFGDIGVFSFCQDKIMTTGGEGGMLITNSEALWDAAWSYKDHGKNYATVHRKDHPPGYRWLHESIGSNLRMTEMQAAIGRIQLGRLERWVARRQRLAGILNDALQDVPALRLTVPPAGVTHAYYKYYVFVRPERLAPGWSRDRIAARIAARGVRCFTGSCPEIYREKALQPWAPPSPLPVARELGETSLMFEVHPTLGDEHVALSAAIIRDVALQAGRDSYDG